MRIDFESWCTTDTARVVGRKAIAVLAGCDGFEYARVRSDGSAEGYSADVRVAVFTLPVGDRTRVWVATSGMTAATVTRVKRQVREQLASRSADGPDLIGRRNPAVERTLPTLEWHTAERPLLPSADRVFGPAVAAVAGRYGLVADGAAEVPEAGVQGVCMRSRESGMSLVHYQCVPGTPGIATQFVTVSAAAPGLSLLRPAREAGEALTRRLYD